MSKLALFVLGSPFCQRNGISVQLDRHKALALLCYLAVTGVPHRRDELALLLWPDYDHTRARAALRRTLAALNRALDWEVIEADRETIGFRREGGYDLQVDADQFHHNLALCRTHGHSENQVCADCLSPLTDAIALYRGDFLSGFTLRDSPDFDDWELFQTESLRQEFVGALTRLVRCLIDRQEFESALRYARQWLALDPLNETAHCYLMSLYTWTGQRHAALRQYVECAHLLEQELGIPPQEATTHLYQAVKANEFAPLPFPAQYQHEKIDQMASIRRETRPADADHSLTLLARTARGQLVGRARELAEMDALWKRTLSGETHVLLLGGEAGIGKTRLVQEFTVSAESSGARVLTGKCHSEGNAPYSPISQMIRTILASSRSTDYAIPAFILADLLTLAPQLRPRYPEILPNPRLDPNFERERVFDSFVSWCEKLSEQAPLVLWLEDANWADSGTLSLVRHLARVTQKARLLIVMTYRDTDLELAGPHTLNQLVLELDRERLVTQTRLSRLTRDQTRELLATMLMTGGEISPEFLDSIYRETEGNPFFTEEVCKALIEEGTLYFAGGYWRRSDIERIVIPPNVRATILSRLEKLSPPVQEMLNRAAILGREFDFATLQAMLEWDEDTLLRTLEHAERAQLFHEAAETGKIRFAFAHILIPFAIRESLSPLRRQREHRRAAEIIERQQRNNVEALAHHYLAAGEAKKAIEYACRAAERAIQLFTFDVAAKYLQTALDLLQDHGNIETRIAVLERLADVHNWWGERTQAVVLYLQALEGWRGLADADKWTAVRLHRKIAETVSRISSHEDIQRFAQEARLGLDAALKLTEGEAPHRETVRLLAAFGQGYWQYFTQLNWETVEQYGRAAVQMAEQLDSPTERSIALGALAITLGGRDRFRESAQVAVQRVAVTHDPRFDDVRERVDSVFGAANALLYLGEYAQAMSYLQHAEALVIPLRDISGQAYALAKQAECYFYLDQWDEVVVLAHRRYTLVQRYGLERIGRMCFYCGLTASVHALRGEREESQYWYNEAVTFMSNMQGPTIGNWPGAMRY